MAAGSETKAKEPLLLSEYPVLIHYHPSVIRRVELQNIFLKVKSSCHKNLVMPDKLRLD
jgi:hypothetical protein